MQKQNIANNTEVDRIVNVLRGQVKKNGNVDRNFIDVMVFTIYDEYAVNSNLVNGE